MKKKYVVLIICILGVIFNSSKSNSQGFNSISTPDGINIIAVGNSGLLYRSSTAGNTWSSIPNGSFNMNEVNSFGNDVWIASDNGIVFKTLKTASPILTYNVGISNDLNSIDFINSSTGFVCGNTGVVFKTTNGGVNWNSINSGIDPIDLNGIDFINGSIGRVVGNNGKIYVTSNGGSTWVAEVSGTNYNLTDVKLFESYAVVTGEYGIILNKDVGSWNSIDTRTRSDIRAVSGTGSSDVHVCGGGGFIRNNKSGSSNYFNFEINPIMADLVDIYYHDDNFGWAVSSLNNIIIYTTNGGINWEMPSGSSVSFQWQNKLSSSGGIGNNLCPHPTDKNSMFVVYGSKVYVSRDRGDNWTQIATVSGGGSAHSFYVSPLDTNVWVCAITSSPDRVTRTTNYGATWTTSISRNFSNYGQPLEMDQNNPSTYYFAPDGSGFYKSVDDGATFTEISNNYPFRSPCDVMVMWDSSDVIFVGDGVTGSGQAQIFKSVNKGVNWSLVKTASASEIPSMCNTVFDQGLMYATEWSGSNIYKSSNYGSNWITSHSTGFSGWASGFCQEDPTVTLTGNYGSQSSLTTNNGSTWNTIAGMSGAGAGMWVEDRGYLLSMQTSSLWKLKINYSFSPQQTIVDVEITSIGDRGIQYYPDASILPYGTVRNNGQSAATFNVTRKINPGNYVSTKTISALDPMDSTNVIFDKWNFQSGITYLIRDSVYLSGENVTYNNIKSDTLIPYVGLFSYTLNQDFSQLVFPPTNWTRTGAGAPYWKHTPNVSAYGNDSGSAYYNFWNANTNIPYQYLITPTFTTYSTSGYLEYDYAYAPFSSGTDSITIETSTNGGSTFSTLVNLYGNASATGQYAMNTRGVSGIEFIPEANDWQSKIWSLPVGTNKIRFRAKSGYANNFYLDNVKVKFDLNYTQLDLILAPQGLYNGVTLNISDSIKVFLRNTSSPYSIVDSSNAVIDSISLTVSSFFQNLASGNYFIQVKHRNALESWSKAGGHPLTNGIFSLYDFTTSRSQTYGNNSILNGSKYCFYSGDVNKDGFIDINDQSNIENDGFNFNSGYIDTDLNGDYVVDIADIVIAENNAYNFVSVISP